MGAGFLKVVILSGHPGAPLLVEQELRKADFAFVSYRASNEAGWKKLIQSFRPDLVFSEFYLDDLTALDALKELRSIHPDVPFVVVTADQNPTLLQQSIRAGVDDYILLNDGFRLAGVAKNLLMRRREKVESAGVPTR